MAANIKAAAAKAHTDFLRDPKKAKGKKDDLMDLWAEDPVAKSRPANDWVAANRGSTKVPLRYQKKIQRAPEKTPIPAVVVAHSGASVRPDEEAREELEAIATGKELTRLDQKLLQEEARSGRMPQQGIIFSGMGDAYDEEEDDEELYLSHRVVEDKKMTKTQRNKQKRHKEQQKAADKARETKAKLKQINRTGEFQKEISKEKFELEKKHKEAERYRAEMAKQQPKKLGRHTYDEARPEVKLADEIAPDLRQLEVEGNLFRDRFQSLQKRNIIQATGGAMKKKRRYKLKVKHYINTNGTGINGLGNHVERMDTRHTLTNEEKAEMQPGKGKRKRK